jgi:hypothetical protein
MWRPIGQRALGLVMGFGAGVLISAVAFELVVPAITEAEEGGHWKVALALGAGAMTFYFGDGVIDRMGGDKRKSPNAAGGSALALTLGIVLDGIPESVALGLTLLGGEGVSAAMLPYDEETVERALGRWPGVRCCYEAGPTGFGLHRHLVERGFECQVVAPGLVPQRPGERVKTDPGDARKLARLLAGGLLEPIHVPTREQEAARDLVRACEDARLDRMRDRHRLSKFCLRQGSGCPVSPGVSRGGSGSPSSGSTSSPGSRPSRPTCTPSTSSTAASRRSSA